MCLDVKIIDVFPPSHASFSNRVVIPVSSCIKSGGRVWSQGQSVRTNIHRSTGMWTKFGKSEEKGGD